MKGPVRIHPVILAGSGDPAPTPPEKLRAGTGAAQVWNAFSNASNRFHVGHWRGAASRFDVSYTETELCVILSGRVRLTDASGAAEFGPGEAFVIDAGFVGTWESIGEVTKIYAILEP